MSVRAITSAMSNPPNANLQNHLSGSRPTRFDAASIDALFSELNAAERPGVTVGIAIGGIPVYRRSFGLANVELATPLSPTIRMRIGSITKHFTALAFMLLCEAGEADLDDPIGRFVPELHRATADATIRSLITHTSGIRDIFDIGLTLCGAGKAIHAAQYRAQYARIDTIDSEPGRRWSYNNGGYVLLTEAVERIAGQPLDTFLHSHVFLPAGMHRTRLRRRDDDFLVNAATLHVADGQGGYTRDYMGMDLGGEGGIVSTIDDMLRWLQHMEAPVVGSPQTWATMLRPHRLANGASTQYGLGLMLHDYRGVATIAHPGTVFGGNAQIVKVPSAGLDVVVIANCSDISTVALAEAILDVVIPDLAPLPSRAPTMALNGAFLGVDTGTLITLHQHTGAASLSINGNDSDVQVDTTGTRLVATSPGLQGSGVELRASEQTPFTIDYFVHGSSERADRITSTGARAGIDGRYTLDVPAITLRILGNGSRLESCGPFGSTVLTLERVADDVWLARAPKPYPIAAVLTFSPDRNRLFVSTARTMRLNFIRTDDTNGQLGDDG